MDIKGDLSGIAAPGAGHPKIDERHARIGLPYEAGGSPVEMLTLPMRKGEAQGHGSRIRTGAVLEDPWPEMDTQSGVMAVIFTLEDQDLPLLDLQGCQAGKCNTCPMRVRMNCSKIHGLISIASVGRSCGRSWSWNSREADRFFGEPFDVEDLLR